MTEDVQKGKSSTRAKNKYNSINYDSLRVVVPKGQKEVMQAHARSQGESLNGFINRAANETMERDSTKADGE